MASQDPEAYKKTPAARFTINDDVEDIYATWDKLVPAEAWESVEEVVLHLIDRKVATSKELNRELMLCRRKQKRSHRKCQMHHVFMSLLDAGKVTTLSAAETDALRRQLVKKSSKSTSGVLVVTVLTSPYPQGQAFSCEWNCYYCPNEPGQPRSYLHDEPSVLRANRNSFDPVLQFCDRAATLAMNGHPVDKVELLVLGGTWASYPHAYQESFVRDLFFAANTFYSRRLGERRERLSLAGEKALNEKARCKIIGLTLETRPDCITPAELRRFRRYGCTRVQLGVQHTDDSILRKINRGCTTQDTKRALQLLKDSCYKVDIHLMPNLPGADVAADARMFAEVLDDEYLQADQWKIYPCETTPWTVIQGWFESGKYTPYAEEALLEVLIEAKTKVHPWIRLNRVVRDIPSQYILGGVDNPSMRQLLQARMKERGLACRCIRCREVKDQVPPEAELVTRTYAAQGGTEYFISFESSDRSIIMGFARLRINRLVGCDASASASAAEEANIPSPGISFVSSHDIVEGGGWEAGEAGEAGEELEGPEVLELLADDEQEQERERERGRTRGRSRDASAEGGDEEEEDGEEQGERAAGRRRARSKSPAAALRASAQAARVAREDGATEARSAAPRQAKRRGAEASDAEAQQALTPFPELVGAALVRELHVYGQLVPTRCAKGDEQSQNQNQNQDQSKDQSKDESQHVGLGTRLMAEAERVARTHGASRVAVISGVGVRDFYRRLGYDLEGEGEMMIKHLQPLPPAPAGGMLRGRVGALWLAAAIAVVVAAIAVLSVPVSLPPK